MSIERKVESYGGKEGGRKRGRDVKGERGKKAWKIELGWVGGVGEQTEV